MRVLGLWWLVACGSGDVDADGSDASPADTGPTDAAESATPTDPPHSDDTDTDPVLDTFVPPVGDCARYAAPDPAPSAITGGAMPFEALPAGVDSFSCLMVQDLDGDGHVDVAWGAPFAAPSVDRGLHVRWGAGGRDATITDHDLGATPYACLPGDLDGDGTLEVQAFTLDGLWVIDGFETRTPVATRVWEDDTDVIQRPVFSAARLDLDRDGDDDLVFTVTGVNNPCGEIEVDTDDFVVITDGQIMGSVGCLQDDGGTWSLLDTEPCPAALRAHETVYPFHLALQDLGHDGWPEVFATGDYAENVFLVSTPTGWEDRSAASGLGVYNHAMGAAWFDEDGDGLRDLFVPDLGPSQLRRSFSCDTFFDVAGPTGIAEATRRSSAYGPVLADLDHDGADELFVVQNIEWEGDLGDDLCDGFGGGALVRPHDFLLHPDGAGRWSRLDVPGPDGGTARDWVTVFTAQGDLDGDGDLDVVVLDELRGAVVFWNDQPKAGRWLAVAPVDAQGAPVWGTRVVVRHPDGGARVRELWPTTGTHAASEPVAHFGLGTEDGPLVVRVRWPDGRWTTHRDVAVDQRQVVVAP